MRKYFAPLTLLLTVIIGLIAAAPTKKKKILFFTKSSGFEHSVISWNQGKPSWAEKVLLEIGDKQQWEFVFSKDGSLFSKEYLAQFDAVLFYTTGNLLEAGTDKQPPMTAEGKQALLDYVKNGGALLGTHSASDTFHTNNEKDKGPDRFVNHGEKADPYIRCLGGEFIMHQSQQVAEVTNTDLSFPGYEKQPASYKLLEEWYSLKDFRDDLHVLGVIDSTKMHDPIYKRPPYPVTWARTEGKGKVWYTAMGHREDVWTNPMFQEILTGGLRWAMGEAPATLKKNLKEVAPEAGTNPAYFPQKK